MKNLFSIGEVSKIKGVTIKALRYYHKMGILIPRHIDNTTGYRYYSIDQFIHIDIIKGCRELGTSIIELQDIFNKYNTDELLEFLQMKKYEAQSQIIKMKEVINNIDTLNMSVEKSKSILDNREITTSFFEKRYIITTQFKESGILKELIYYSNLDKIIQNENVETLIERGILYNIDSKDNIEPKYAFNVIKDNNIKQKEYIKVLREGNYLTLAYTKENELECKRKVFDYIKEKNLEVKNFIELDLLNDFFNTKSYSCQIQMLLNYDKLI
ncbi:MerR family transcriptional regulator [Paraclostridium sordellii]|nr:helix-turn-helix domain-containing protein [Paeniclostridium sordellii]